jgi:rubrerythrin
MDKMPVSSYPMPEYWMLYDPDAADGELSAGSAIERLLAEFEAHEEKEREVVRRYKEMAEGSRKPLVAFLLGLIIADEEKHHRVTQAMLSTLKGDVLWTRPKEAIQGLTELRDGHEEIVKLADDFIRVEKEGIEEYKKLIRESKGYYKDLFVLLLESMIRDSEKHVAILEFLRKRLKEA